MCTSLHPRENYQLMPAFAIHNFAYNSKKTNANKLLMENGVMKVVAMVGILTLQKW